MQTILHFLRREQGATVIEYAVMLGAIVAVIIGTVQIFGANVQGTFASSVDVIRAITP
jgi:Flp pilus assembly pilin Flp